MEISIKYKEGDKVYEPFVFDVKEYTVKEFLGIDYHTRTKQPPLISYLLVSDGGIEVIKFEKEIFSTYKEALDEVADKNVRSLPTRDKELGKLIIEKYSKLLGL